MNYENVPTETKVKGLASKYLTFTATEGGALDLKENTDYVVEVRNPKGNAIGSEDTLSDVGTYTVTVSAKDGGNCTGSQTFSITTAHSCNYRCYML